MTLYSILQANLDWFHIKAANFFSLKILDTSSSATLFVTLIGAMLVRHQFALGVLPRINYKSKISTRQNAGESYETWHVEIYNTGLGSAIINYTEYYLGLKNSDSNSHGYSFNGLITQLASIGLILDFDYWLENITIGFSLSPKDYCFVFEVKTEHLQKLKHLSIYLYFQGQLGDKYCREISFIPRIMI